jgi:dihydroflavonol-4-reductase
LKPVLVTGATGFLGQHLLALLRRRSSPAVRVLARGEAPRDVEVIRGDITVESDVERAVSGCSSVYHLAGWVSRDPAGAAPMRRVHVDGTRLLCEAALRHQVERIVVASSSGTIAVSRAPVEHTEESGYKNDLVSRWPYYMTKIEQEQLALRYWAEHSLPVVVINPSLLLGPGDKRRSSTGDVEAFLEGQVLSTPMGGLSLVDVRDCASGAILAMERGRGGERYLMGAVNWSMRRFLNELGRLSGIRPPMLAGPAWMSLAFAPLLRLVMPALGRKFEIDDESIRMSAMYWFLDSTKARRELGFVTRDPSETLRDTIDYLRANPR